MGKKNKKQFCRRRPNSHCSVETYSEDMICAGCKADLEELAEDLVFIKELGLISNN